MSDIRNMISDLKSQLSIEKVAHVDKRSQFIHCPFHDDTNPSLFIFPNGTFKCFSTECGVQGDVIDWLGYTRFGRGYSATGSQLAQVIDLIASLGINPMTPTQREEYRRKHNAIAPAVPNPAQVNQIRQELTNLALKTHQTLLDNKTLRDPLYFWGLNDEVIDRNKLGFDGLYYTIPAWYRGVCLSIKKRITPAKEGHQRYPKYTSQTGSSWVLYGSDLLVDNPQTPHVVITEDEKSALALQSQGVFAIASTGGAGFWGSSKSRFWQRLLMGVSRLTFWRDFDEKGIPPFDPQGSYKAGDTVVLPDESTIWVSRVDDPDTSTDPDLNPDWSEGQNAGLTCALDFRGQYPRAEIVDSRGYKDAGDYIVAGYDWRDVVLN